MTNSVHIAEDYETKEENIYINKDAEQLKKMKKKTTVKNIFEIYEPSLIYKIKYYIYKNIICGKSYIYYLSADAFLTFLAKSAERDAVA